MPIIPGLAVFGLVERCFEKPTFGYAGGRKNDTWGLFGDRLFFVYLQGDRMVSVGCRRV